MSKRNALLATVHIAKKELDMDDVTYRDVLQAQIGVSSAGDATDKQLVRLVAYLRDCGWSDNRPKEAKHTKPTAIKGCEGLMDKIEAQLADAKLPWSYAEAIAKRVCKVARLEWCNAAHLGKVIGALERNAQYRERGLRA